MPIPHRPKASLGCSSTNTKAVVARAKLMYSGLFTNVATFVSPTVALTAFLALITALESVQAATTTTKGLTTTRNAKRALVWSAMESLCAYVQSLADAVTPTEAVVLIKSAGLVVAEVAAHEKGSSYERSHPRRAPCSYERTPRSSGEEAHAAPHVQLAVEHRPKHVARRPRDAYFRDHDPRPSAQRGVLVPGVGDDGEDHERHRARPCRCTCTEAPTDAVLRIPQHAAPTPRPSRVASTSSTGFGTPPVKTTGPFSRAQHVVLDPNAAHVRKPPEGVSRSSQRRARPLGRVVEDRRHLVEARLDGHEHARR